MFNLCVEGINLNVIPLHFREEIERQQHLREREEEKKKSQKELEKQKLVKCVIYGKREIDGAVFAVWGRTMFGD